MPDRRHDGEGKTNNVNNAWSNSWVARGKYYEKHGKKHATGTVYLPAAYKPGQIVGSYIDRETLMCVPIIPNPVVIKSTGGDNNNNNGNNPVKAGTDANFLSLVFSALPDYNIQEALSLKALTGNEILQVAHRQNFYTNNEVLNRNIVDLVESRNIYSATEIIKLQKPDYSYLYQNNLGAYSVSLTSSIITIQIPIGAVNNSSKIQVEGFTPREIKNDTIY
jgi:hypothetical protein